MNRKVIKVSHIFMESNCCVCNQGGLGQFFNIRENFVNVRGKIFNF
jgi:hypothetical protein